MMAGLPEAILGFIFIAAMWVWYCVETYIEGYRDFEERRYVLPPWSFGAKLYKAGNERAWRKTSKRIMKALEDYND